MIQQALVSGIFLASMSSSRSLVVGKSTCTRVQEYHLILFNNSSDSVDNSDSRDSSDSNDQTKIGDKKKCDEKKLCEIFFVMTNF